MAFVNVFFLQKLLAPLKQKILWTNTRDERFIEIWKCIYNLKFFERKLSKRKKLMCFAMITLQMPLLSALTNEKKTPFISKNVLEAIVKQIDFNAIEWK